MLAFKGVAIVTGAAQGIGEAIARSLAASGASVVVADIQADKAVDVAASMSRDGYTAVGHHVDVADTASAEHLVEETISTFGRVDALVNNGALDAQPGEPWEVEDEQFRRLIDIDLSGQWWCTKAVLPTMMRQRSGRIVMVSSSSIYIGGHGLSVGYRAAKSGLVGLTVGLSSQLEAHGILVNCLVPGATGSTGTPMEPADVPVFLDNHPLGFGGTQPMVDAVEYLLGSSGDWVSGSIMNVTGGRVRGH